jgi:hypothetical protein
MYMHCVAQAHIPSLSRSGKLTHRLDGPTPASNPARVFNATLQEPVLTFIVVSSTFRRNITLWATRRLMILALIIAYRTIADIWPANNPRLSFITRVLRTFVRDDKLNLNRSYHR